MITSYRNLARIAVICLAILALTTCLSVAKTKIVHYTATHGHEFHDFLRERKEAFEAANPDLEIVMDLATGNYTETALVRIAGNVQIDVLDSTHSFMVLFGKGLLAPLSSFMERDPDAREEDLPPVAIQAFTAEGQLYGVASQLYAIGATYNRTLFDMYGVQTPKQLGEDWTWQALYKIVPKLSKDTDGDGEIDQFGVSFSASITRIHAAVHQAGGRLYDRYLNPTRSFFDSPEVRTGLGFYVEVAHSGFGRSSWGARELAQRKAVINLNGTSADWAMQGYGDIPDVIEVGLQPRGPVRRGANMYFGPYQVAASCADVGAAWRWISFLTFNEESQARFFQATGRMPVYLPVVRDLEAYMDDTASAYGRFMLDFRNLAIHPDNVPHYLTPAEPEIGRIFNPRFSQVLKGDMALESMLNIVQPLIQAELDALHGK